MIRTMLVDDEEPARDRLRDMLSGFDDVDVVGEARDGEDALTQIAGQRPDLIFLDIQMPGLSGMEVAASLSPPRPRIIFCTAFDQYAIDAFEHHATDYLLKPVSRKRLAKALDRVRMAMSEQVNRLREVADATRTQERLLPQSPPPVEGLDYSGVCRAAHGVGGDYYDFLLIGENRLGIALADVSGKGLFAGLLVASLQARIQSIAPLHGDSLGALVAEANRLTHSSTDSNRYATFFYGLYDGRTRNLNYVNAGHNPPLLFRPDSQRPGGGSIQPLAANGTVIGMLPEAIYEQESVQLETGDVLLMFTDGVTESLNPDGEEFGESRLVDAIRCHARLPAREMQDAVLDEVTRFVAAAPRHDDLTLVVAKAVQAR